jgi:hypothetical protein
MPRKKRQETAAQSLARRAAVALTELRLKLAVEGTKLFPDEKDLPEEETELLVPYEED